jgi:hypothetical protein
MLLHCYGIDKADRNNMPAQNGLVATGITILQFSLAQIIMTAVE